MKANFITLLAILALTNLLTAQSKVFSIPERAEGATSIFEGKVIEKTSFWNKNKTSIYTTNKVEVFKSFKGSTTSKTIEIVTRGGFVGDDFVLLPHETELEVGDEGMFFLIPNNFRGIEEKANAFRTYPGRQGVVRYVNFGKKQVAFDEFKSYNDLNRDLYQPILSIAGTEIKEWRPNSSEKSNLPPTTEPPVQESPESEKIIEFTFENIALTSTELLEFDIFVKTNQESILFCGAELFVEYSTEPFGINVVANDNIEITKGTVLQSSAYTLAATDDSTDVVKAAITSNLGSISSLYTLTTLKEQLCHVKVTIQDLSALAFIGFDAFKMAGKSEYYDPVQRICVRFDKIILDNPISHLLPPEITLITPDTLPAGIDAILTIFGNNFGAYDTAFCRVKFRNADDPNANPWMTARKGDILDWQDNFIDVIVPSSAVSGFTAGEGKVVVVNGMGSDTSDQKLDVPYSVLTRRLNSPDREFRFEPKRQINNPFIASGIEFTLNDSILLEDPLVDDITEQSIEDWRCATGIAWSLSPVSSPLVTAAANDGINLIYSDDPSQIPNDVLAHTILTGTRVAQCGVGGSIFYVRDIDIAFRNDNTFYYVLSGPIQLGKYDFYGTMLHELGHAHMLDHAIPISEKIMYPFLAAGDADRRTIYADDITGGKAVIASSQSNLGAGFGCPEGINTNPCGPTASEENLLDANIRVAPNPFHDEIKVEFEILKSLNLRIHLIDPMGKVILFDDLGFFLSGKHNFSYTFQQEIPSGFYFLRFSDEHGAQLFKLIKI